MNLTYARKIACSWSRLLTVFAVFLLFSYSYADLLKVVAKVGDTEITEADLQGALEQYMPSGVFHAGIDRSSKGEYRDSALNDLINRELLWREAQKRGIKASDANVDALMKLNVKRFGSEEKMKKALQELGLTTEILMEKIRHTAMAETLLRDLAAENRTPDEEVRKYYEDNRSKYRKPDGIHLYHILVSVEPTASDEVWKEKKKFAEQLLEKIKGGANFGDMAYQYSDDPYKYKSGDLGLVHRGRLTPPELEEAAFALKKDEVSGVITTIHGYHILKAGDKVEGGTKDFESVKERIRKELDGRRFEEARKSLLEKLAKEYSVQKMPESNGVDEVK